MEAAKRSAPEPKAGKPKRQRQESSEPAVVLLFYQYVQPHWTDEEVTDMILFQESVGAQLGIHGRLRVANEGLNGNFTGHPDKIEAYCQALRDKSTVFATTDFKVAPTESSKQFKGFKVWKANSLVGLGVPVPEDVPIGTHLSPQAFHDLLHAAEEGKESIVLIDARNTYETRLGTFKIADTADSATYCPPTNTFTEFPHFVDTLQQTVGDVTGKTIMMCCTGGVRCEQSSAYVRKAYPQAKDIVQLSGGIHRYLEAFPTGGYFKGLNYVFDRREVHGPGELLSGCVCCQQPWASYKGKRRCCKCRTLVLVCDDCQSRGNDRDVELLCENCSAAAKQGTVEN